MSHKKTNTKTAFLSEGKNYWSTFKPIIEALIDKQVFFSYYTFDKKDPGLSVKNKFISSKYLGRGVWGYYKASTIEAELLVSTTPNIGNARFPIKRSPNVKNLIHVFHSITDISIYKKGSLDFYDTVILAGDFQTESIREIEKIRNLPQKELVCLGLPYIDELVKEKVENVSNKSHKTILVGSSWGAKGCLNSYGIEFIEKIASAGYDVIIRPHPQSYISEPKRIKGFEKQLKNYTNIDWDNEVSPSRAMSKADLLISDTSSIRFDFAFLYKKPVITLAIEPEEMAEYERADLNYSWSDEAEKNIGFVLNKNSVGNIVEYIARAEKEYDASKIESFRDKTICNFGKAGEAISNYLLNKIGENQNKINERELQRFEYYTFRCRKT